MTKEELEKENTELKEKLEKEIAHRIRNFNKAIEWKEKHRVLKKENAELKEMYHESDEDNNKLRENIPLLAKAKEIIKLLLWDLRNRSYEPVKDVEQAEQFLKEVEKC